jgi:alkylation response protein AidB-like acyl-CoA dehydrogenase
MNLTEPQAGSDLGLVRTRAEPAGNGLFRISGAKIFISGGEHDLTDNIVHLVLARLPDAPGGTKGLSLFLVPKVRPDGTRNAVSCDGIEKKMGIKGSATCAMRYDNATGWLIGEPNRGLGAMFVMMNAARLHVGLLGVGHMESAQQNAHAYARERVQGRGRPIVEHPAVRRTLWTLRALVEGERVIAYWTALLLDEAHHHPAPARRALADALVGLLTPVAKAFFTENGHSGADAALQVWGGYGFVHDYGIEQTVRDSRIAMIYEGTNEIQAIDLLQRKVLDDGGGRLETLLVVLEEEAARAETQASLTDFAAALRAQVTAARTATALLVAGRAAEPSGHCPWPTITCARSASRCSPGRGRSVHALHCGTPVMRGTTTRRARRTSASSGCSARRPGAGSACGRARRCCRRHREKRSSRSHTRLDGAPRGAVYAIDLEQAPGERRHVPAAAGRRA